MINTSDDPEVFLWAQAIGEVLRLAPQGKRAAILGAIVAEAAAQPGQSPAVMIAARAREVDPQVRRIAPRVRHTKLTPEFEEGP
jgi:hypothetical protein